MHSLLVVVLGLVFVGFSTYTLVRALQGFMVLRSGRQVPFKSKRMQILSAVVSVVGIFAGIVLVLLAVAFKG